MTPQTLRGLDQPPRAAAHRPAFGLWRLGFRPFYLLASAFAAISIALWALQFAGLIRRPYLAGPLWHAHEMLFGFGLAVLVGFLFTAGRNWTGRPTPTGGTLMALAALWLAGRILVLTPFGWAAAIAGTAFPFAAAVALAIPFFAAGVRRNYFFVGLLVLLGVADFVFHLVRLQVLELPARLGIQVGLDVLLFIMAVMGGRVIPMFTNNGIPGVRARRDARLERLALGSVLAVLLADLLQQSGAVFAALLGVAAVAHLLRLALWQPWRTARVPLVWILHAAYAWIGVHFALRALSELGWLGSSVPAHALTVGAIGGLTIGMMTRTARGHTGQPLRADRYDIASYVLVLAAALVRVVVPVLTPQLHVDAVLVSAAFWSAGYAIYAMRYWPLLTRARLDGQPG
ncbi:MAG TPA: NnrS family protein [Burkholderiaceae bacterium]|nr:NnrS family protein [Burkholderiaceae bacterium]